MRVTDSKEENAVPSRRRLRSADTLETVVVRCGGGSWPKADCGPSSTGQQWCTGFWSTLISSVPAGWYLQWRCGEWLSAGHVCSGSETPPAPSSGSGPLPLPGRQELMSEEGWSPVWLPDLPVCCQKCQCEMGSTECGYWRFYWWRRDEIKLRCRLSQVDGPDLLESVIIKDWQSVRILMLE